MAGKPRVNLCLNRARLQRHHSDNPMNGLLRWLILALLINGIWELGHLPMYTLWTDPDAWRIATYVGHCLIGDGLIAGAIYLAIAVLLHNGNWPYHQPWLGGALFITLAVSYTAYSEWRNVYVHELWAYAPSMPLIAGIGLTPLLQWTLVPALMVTVHRKWN